MFSKEDCGDNCVFLKSSGFITKFVVKKNKKNPPVITSDGQQKGTWCMGVNKGIKKKYVKMDISAIKSPFSAVFPAKRSSSVTFFLVSFRHHVEASSPNLLLSDPLAYKESFIDSVNYACRAPIRDSNSSNT